MSALLAGVLGASLAGSIHCVGMCGGFVALAAGGGGGAAGMRRRSLPQLSYHAGRLIAYLTLGIAAGTLGSAVALAGDTAGLANVAPILAGATMIAIGGLAVARALGARLPKGPRFAGLSRVLARAHLAWNRRTPVWRALVLGVLTSLLPCGWLWAFVVTAAGTATPWGGALVMAAFWLGTVPALLGFGLGLGALLVPLKKRLPMLTPLLLVAVGLVMVVWRAQMPRLVPDAPEQAEVPSSAPCHHAATP